MWMTFVLFSYHLRHNSKWDARLHLLRLDRIEHQDLHSKRVWQEGIDRYDLRSFRELNWSITLSKTWQADT